MAPYDETELFWQAFRYVGEEMTPAEAMEFELHLADDQSAREAVARVVELSQLVLAAAPEQAAAARLPGSSVLPVSPARQTQATWIQPVGWISIGAAACLTIVLAYQSFAPATGTNPMASLSPASASDLAFAWNAANQSLNNSAADATAEAKIEGPADLLIASDSNSSTDSSNADPMEEFTDPVAPAWLLVAVEDAHATTGQEN